MVLLCLTLSLKHANHHHVVGHRSRLCINSAHTIRVDPLRSLRVLEGVEGFVGVSDKWQTHLGILLGQDLLGMCAMHSRIVLLWNLIDGEVADVDVGRQLRLEWCSNLSELIPDDTPEERVFLDLRGSIMCASFLS